MYKKSSNPKLVRIGEIVARGVINLQAVLAKSPFYVRELERGPDAKLVLKSLRSNGESSLVDLRKATGLKRAALEKAVKELSDSDLISINREGRKLMCKPNDVI